jgi:hypothetical protein
MDYPYIPKNETATELLDMLLDPKKVAERLKAIQDATEIHNRGLKRYEDFKTVEAYKSGVDAAVAEAQAKIAEADKYVEAQKKRSDVLLAKAEQKHVDADTYHREVYRVAKERSDKLDLWEQELTKREEAAARDLASAILYEQRSEGLLKEANQIKTEYEKKCALMKELAA